MLHRGSYGFASRVLLTGDYTHIWRPLRLRCAFPHPRQCSPRRSIYTDGAYLKHATDRMEVSSCDSHDHLQLLLISSHLTLAVFVVLGIRSNARTSCCLGLTTNLSRLLGHTSRLLWRFVVWLSIPGLTGWYLSTMRVLFQVLILEDIQSSVVRRVKMDLRYC